MRRLASFAPVATAGLVTLLAAAAGAQPAIVPVQGFLSDSFGTPVDGALPGVISIHSAATGGALLHTESFACASPPSDCLVVQDGRFIANLGTLAALNLDVFDGTTRYLQVQIGADAPLTPRIAVATTPYAARAQRAAVANAVPWAGITGMPAGFADGVDDVGSYTGTAPIAVNAGTRQIGLSTLDCVAGETWVWNGSSWDCTAVAASGGTTYTAGDGVAITAVGANTVISIDAQTCSSGFYSRWNGTSWGCFADQTGLASIAAGAGISVLGNEVSIGALACPEGNASRWDGAAWRCDPVTATFAGVGLRQVGDELEIDAPACAAGQVSRWTEVSAGNFAWTCVTDQVGITSLSAGGGITVNANQISINSANCDADEYSSFRGGAWVCVPDGTELPATGDGLQLVDVAGVPTLRINAPACAPEQFITWDGSDWACADDTTGLTGIGQGAGIAVAGNVVSIASASCGAHQYSSFRSGAWGCYDVISALDPQAGLVLTGRQLSLDADACTGNQRSVWNGTRFVCVADQVGITSLSRGTGISGTGNQVNINIAAACTPAEPYLTWTASGWDCVADVSSTLSARRGVKIVSGAVEIDAPDCGVNQYATWDNDAGVWSCANDQVGFTALSRGTGITGTGNQVQVDIAAACPPAEPYLTWTASGWDCVADVSSSLTASLTSGLQISGTAISVRSTVCGGTQFSRWTSSGWVCGDDQVGFTSLSRGTGISGTGNQVNVNAAACTPAEPYLTWTASGWDCVADVSSSLTASATSGLNITGTAIRVASPTCVAGQYSWWDGDSWECATDTVGLTSVLAGRGVQVTGGNTVSIPVPDCVAGEVLTFVAGTGWDCVTDTAGTTVTAGLGMRFTGTALEPNITATCNNTTGKLTYNHTTGVWSCVNDFGVTALAPGNGASGVSPIRGSISGTGNRTLTLDLATSATDGATVTTCTAGEVWTYNGTRWMCEPAVTAGAGIEVSAAGQVSISGTGCTTNGQVLTYNGSGWACTTPVVGIQQVDGSSTITVANGTTLPTVSLNSGGCTNGEVWRWDGTAWGCVAAVTQGNGITVSPTGTVSLSYTGNCTAANSFLQYNAGTWTCGTVNAGITSVVGSGAISASTASGTSTVTLAGCGATADQVWKWNGTSWTCGRPISTTESGVHGGLTYSTGGLLQMRTCAADQILKWNATTGWTCAADALGVTSLGYWTTGGTPNATAGLVIGGTAAAPTVGLYNASCVAGEVLRRNAGNTAWECVPAVTQSATVAVDAAGVVSLGVGSGTAGTATVCDAGDVWKWSGTAWECVPDTGGVTSVAPTSANQIAVTNGTTTATLALGTGTGTGVALCEAGEVWRRNPGNTAWECVASASAGTGISVSPNGTIALGVCPTVGHVWKNVGGVMTCAADVDTTGITAVSTASPLTGNGVGTAVSFLDLCAANGVWRRNSADSGWECVVLPQSITGATAVDAAGAIRLTNAACSDGQVMKWSAGVWTCGTDNGTSYTVNAAHGTALSGTEIRLSNSGCVNGEVWKYNGSTWACEPAVTAGTGITVSSAGQVSLTGITTCGAETASRWNGSGWVCENLLGTNDACFSGTQSSTVVANRTIQVQYSGGSYPTENSVQLFTSGGSLVATPVSWNNSNGSINVNYTLTTPGSYFVRFNEHWGDGANGASVRVIYNDSYGAGTLVDSGSLNTLANNFGGCCGNQAAPRQNQDFAFSVAYGTQTVTWGAGSGNCSLPTERQRIVHGAVQSNGDIAGGQGYRVRRISAGRYWVEFLPAFAGSTPPSAVVSQVYQDFTQFTGGGSTLDNALITGLTNSLMEVATGDGGGNKSDRDFTFIVIGRD